MKTLRPASLALLAALAAAVPLSAVGTRFWRIAGGAQFAAGRLRGLSLSREGGLALAPALRRVFASDQALIWTAARDAAGNLYLGTGHRGRVYRLTPAMLDAAAAADPARALWFTAPEPEIFALAVGPDGALYVGSSPGGKVYRIAPDGQSSVYFDPHADYIWSLLFHNHALYVATGDQGLIYRVTSAGRGEKFFATQQRQVMTLAADAAGNILAGTDPEGLIFRISPAGRGFVLFDAPLEEIHQLAVARDGAIYASAQGGAPRPSPAAGAAAVPVGGEPAAPRATVTVVAAAANSSDAAFANAAQSPGPLPGQPAPTITLTRRARRSVAAPNDAAAPAAAGGGGALYRIAPDGAVSVLWRSPTQEADGVLPLSSETAGPAAAGASDFAAARAANPATDGAAPANGAPDLLFSTDGEGRIYRLGPDRAATLLAQTEQEEATRLLPGGGGVYVTTGNLGNLYHLGDSAAARGVFTSKVRDAGGLAHWGDLTWLGRVPAGAGVRFFTRSGNSARPDSTWSPWSPPLTRQGERIASPAARFLQWKVELTPSPAGASPVLDEVTIPYLPENQAPVLTELRARTALSPDAPPASTANAANYVSGPNGELIAAGPRSEAAAGEDGGIDLSWSAYDPDGDPLTFSVYFQLEGETGWTLLRRHLRGDRLFIGGDRLPDGVYKFKVVASDADANPPALAKTAVLYSSPATLDTTPPTVAATHSGSPAAGVALAAFTAHDAVSALVRAEYSIDAGPWRQIFSQDGILDAKTEAFSVRGEGLAAGQHLLMLRVYDAAGNRGSAQALVTVR